MNLNGIFFGFRFLSSLAPAAQKRKKWQAENPSNQDVAVKVDIEQSENMEISSLIDQLLGKTPEASDLGLSQVASQDASLSLEPQKQVIKPEESTPSTKESGGSQDELVSREKPVLPKAANTILDVDFEDSTEKKR